MTNKLILQVIALMIGLAASAFGWFLTYLMLLQIAVSDLTWFVFWLWLPMASFYSVLSKLVEMIDEG